MPHAATDSAILPDASGVLASAPCSSHVAQRVAVLCVAGNSIYHTIPNVEAYDINRDVRTFDGSLPVVAHPPCRSWSAYCAHQAATARRETTRAAVRGMAQEVRRCAGTSGALQTVLSLQSTAARRSAA